MYREIKMDVQGTMLNLWAEKLQQISLILLPRGWHTFFLFSKMVLHIQIICMPWENRLPCTVRRMHSEFSRIHYNTHLKNIYQQYFSIKCITMKKKKSNFYIITQRKIRIQTQNKLAICKTVYINIHPNIYSPKESL